MARLRYNGLTGTLGAAHNDSTTTLTLASKLTYEGGDVPTISGDYIPLSILDSDGNCAEIVYVTAYTSAATTATIVRGAEGTTASAHDNGATFLNGPTVRDAQFFTGPWSWMERPITPHADDFEATDYTAADSVTDAGFSWGNQGSATAAFVKGGLLVKSDTATSAQVRGLFKTAGWTADTTLTAIVEGFGAGTYSGAAPMLMWGTLATPTLIAFTRTGGGDNSFQAITCTNYAFGSATDRGNKIFYPTPPSVQVHRLKYVHSTKVISYQLWQGGGWYTIGTYTAASAPDYWGIGLQLAIGGDHSVNFPGATYWAARINWDPEAD